MYARAQAPASGLDSDLALLERAVQDFGARLEAAEKKTDPIEALAAAPWVAEHKELAALPQKISDGITGLASEGEDPAVLDAASERLDPLAAEVEALVKRSARLRTAAFGDLLPRLEPVDGAFTPGAADAAPAQEALADWMRAAQNSSLPRALFEDERAAFNERLAALERLAVDSLGGRLDGVSSEVKTALESGTLAFDATVRLHADWRELDRHWAARTGGLKGPARATLEEKRTKAGKYAQVLEKVWSSGASLKDLPEELRKKLAAGEGAAELDALLSERETLGSKTEREKREGLALVQAAIEKHSGDPEKLGRELDRIFKEKPGLKQTLQDSGWSGVASDTGQLRAKPVGGSVSGDVPELRAEQEFPPPGDRELRRAVALAGAHQPWPDSFKQPFKEELFRIEEEERRETFATRTAGVLGTMDGDAEAERLRKERLEILNGPASERRRRLQEWQASADALIDGKSSGGDNAFSREARLKAEITARLDGTVPDQAAGEQAVEKLKQLYAENPELAAYRATQHDQLLARREAFAAGSVPDGQEFLASDLALDLPPGTVVRADTFGGRRGLVVPDKDGKSAFTSGDGSYRAALEKGPDGVERVTASVTLDAQGRPVKQYQRDGDKETTVDNVYDEQGRLKTQVLVSGDTKVTVAPSYGPDGRPTGRTEVEEKGGKRIVRTYVEPEVDAQGRRTWTEFEDGAGGLHRREVVAKPDGKNADGTDRYVKVTTDYGPVHETPVRVRTLTTVRPDGTIIAEDMDAKTVLTRRPDGGVTIDDGRSHMTFTGRLDAEGKFVRDEDGAYVTGTRHKVKFDQDGKYQGIELAVDPWTKQPDYDSLVDSGFLEGRQLTREDLDKLKDRFPPNWWQAAANQKPPVSVLLNKDADGRPMLNYSTPSPGDPSRNIEVAYYYDPQSEAWTYRMRDPRPGGRYEESVELSSQWDPLNKRFNDQQSFQAVYTGEYKPTMGFDVKQGVRHVTRHWDPQKGAYVETSVVAPDSDGLRQILSKNLSWSFNAAQELPVAKQASAAVAAIGETGKAYGYMISGTAATAFAGPLSQGKTQEAREDSLVYGIVTQQQAIRKTSEAVADHVDGDGRKSEGRKGDAVAEQTVRRLREQYASAFYDPVDPKKGERMFQERREQWAREYYTRQLERTDLQASDRIALQNKLRSLDRPDKKLLDDVELGHFLLEGEGFGGASGTFSRRAAAAWEQGGAGGKLAAAGWGVATVGVVGSEFMFQSVGFAGVGAAATGLTRAGTALTSFANGQRAAAAAAAAGETANVASQGTQAAGWGSRLLNAAGRTTSAAGKGVGLGERGLQVYDDAEDFMDKWQIAGSMLSAKDAAAFTESAAQLAAIKAMSGGKGKHGDGRADGHVNADGRPSADADANAVSDPKAVDPGAGRTSLLGRAADLLGLDVPSYDPDARSFRVTGEDSGAAGAHGQVNPASVAQNAVTNPLSNATTVIADAAKDTASRITDPSPTPTTAPEVASFTPPSKNTSGGTRFAQTYNPPSGGSPGYSQSADASGYQAPAQAQTQNDAGASGGASFFSSMGGFFGGDSQDSSRGAGGGSGGGSSAGAGRGGAGTGGSTGGSSIPTGPDSGTTQVADSGPRSSGGFGGGVRDFASRVTGGLIAPSQTPDASSGRGTGGAQFSAFERAASPAALGAASGPRSFTPQRVAQLEGPGVASRGPPAASGAPAVGVSQPSGRSEDFGTDLGGSAPSAGPRGMEFGALADPSGGRGGGFQQQGRSARPAPTASEIQADLGRAGRAPKVLTDADIPNPGYKPSNRDAKNIHTVDPSTAKRVIGPIADGVRQQNYVILADGSMRVGVVTAANPKEFGVKHVQVAGGQGVVFSGEIKRNAAGRVEIDLNSGSFSNYGKDAGWHYTPENVRKLQDYAERILGEPVDVVDHSNKAVLAPGREPAAARAPPPPIEPPTAEEVARARKVRQALDGGHAAVWTRRDLQVLDFLALNPEYAPAAPKAPSAPRPPSHREVEAARRLQQAFRNGNAAVWGKREIEVLDYLARHPGYVAADAPAAFGSGASAAGAKAAPSPSPFVPFEDPAASAARRAYLDAAAEYARRTGKRLPLDPHTHRLRDGKLEVDAARVQALADALSRRNAQLDSPAAARPDPARDADAKVAAALKQYNEFRAKPGQGLIPQDPSIKAGAEASYRHAIAIGRGQAPSPVGKPELEQAAQRGLVDPVTTRVPVQKGNTCTLHSWTNHLRALGLDIDVPRILELVSKNPHLGPGFASKIVARGLSPTETLIVYKVVAKSLGIGLQVVSPETLFETIAREGRGAAAGITVGAGHHQIYVEGLVAGPDGRRYVAFIDSNAGGRTVLPLEHFARMLRTGGTMADPRAQPDPAWDAQIARFGEELKKKYPNLASAAPVRFADHAGRFGARPLEAPPVLDDPDLRRMADANDMKGLARKLAEAGGANADGVLAPDRVYRGLGLDAKGLQTFLENLAGGKGVPALAAYTPAKLAEFVLAQTLQEGADIAGGLFKDRTPEVQAALAQLEGPDSDAALQKLKALFAAEVEQRVKTEPGLEARLFENVAQAYLEGVIPPFMQSTAVGGADGIGSGGALYFAIEKGLKEGKNSVVVEFDRPGGGFVDMEAVRPKAYPDGTHELVMLGGIPGAAIQAVWINGRRFTPGEFGPLAMNQAAPGPEFGSAAPDAAVDPARDHAELERYRDALIRRIDQALRDPSLGRDSKALLRMVKSEARAGAHALRFETRDASGEWELGDRAFAGQFAGTHQIVFARNGIGVDPELVAAVALHEMLHVRHDVGSSRASPGMRTERGLTPAEMAISEYVAHEEQTKALELWLAQQGYDPASPPWGAIASRHGAQTAAYLQAALSWREATKDGVSGWRYLLARYGASFGLNGAQGFEAMRRRLEGLNETRAKLDELVRETDPRAAQERYNRMAKQTARGGRPDWRKAEAGERNVMLESLQHRRYRRMLGELDAVIAGFERDRAAFAQEALANVQRIRSQRPGLAVETAALGRKQARALELKAAPLLDAAGSAELARLEAELAAAAKKGGALHDARLLQAGESMLQAMGVPLPAAPTLASSAGVNLAARGQASPSVDAQRVRDAAARAKALGPAGLAASLESAVAPLADAAPGGLDSAPEARAQLSKTLREALNEAARRRKEAGGGKILMADEVPGLAEAALEWNPDVYPGDPAKAEAVRREIRRLDQQIRDLGRSQGLRLEPLGPGSELMLQILPSGARLAPDAPKSIAGMKLFWGARPDGTVAGSPTPEDARSVQRRIEEGRITPAQLRAFGLTPELARAWELFYRRQALLEPVVAAPLTLPDGTVHRGNKTAPVRSELFTAVRKALEGGGLNLAAAAPDWSGFQKGFQEAAALDNRANVEDRKASNPNLPNLLANPKIDPAKRQAMEDSAKAAGRERDRLRTEASQKRAAVQNALDAAVRAHRAEIRKELEAELLKPRRPASGSAAMVDSNLVVASAHLLAGSGDNGTLQQARAFLEALEAGERVEPAGGMALTEIRAHVNRILAREPDVARGLLAALEKPAARHDINVGSPGTELEFAL